MAARQIDDRWDTQPTDGDFEIDWSHPLAQRLVSMAWNGRNYVNGVALTNVGTALVSSPAHAGMGRGSGIAQTYTGSSSGLAETVSNFDTSQGLSIHVIVNPTNLTATNTFAGFGTGATNRYAVLDLSGTESNDPIRVIHSPDGSTFGGTYYNSPPTNQWNSYTGVFVGGTNNILYRDGVLLTPSSTAGSSSAGFPTVVRIDHGQSSHTIPVNILNGRLLLTMHWQRRLTAADARMLADNPWQVLRRRVFVPVAAAGGGPQTLTPTRFDNANAFYAATLTRARVAEPWRSQPGRPVDSRPLEPIQGKGRFAFVQNELFATGSSTPSQTLTATRFDNTSSFYAATVTTGGVTLTPGLFSNTSDFYAATVSQAGGAQALTATRFDNSNAFYAATAGRGAVTLTASRFDNTPTFYAATVGRGAVTLLPTLAANDNTFYAATITGGAPSIAAVGIPWMRRRRR